KRAAQALQEAHDQLEQRVRERTAELTAANERLRREVAERKRAEDALRAKTEELRSSGEVLARLAEEQTTLLRHTRDFLYRHDRHGVFTYLSPAVESLTGYTVEEWKTHYTTYLTDNPLNEKVREYTEETLRTGRESPPYRVAIRHKQGHEVILEVNERPYFEDGEVAGIIGVARDITDRVRAEEDLKRAKEAAEAANRAKTAFLANVSHEIRTPLTAMLAAAELFAANADPVQRERYADPILTNGRHLLNLIDDLLDLSQAESGRLDIVIRSCSLPELVGDVLSVVSPLHRRPSVELSVRYETPVPAWIRTDPTRLKQAVINLLANALKFTREGIVQLRIRVDRDAEEPRLRIVVRDSGPGIDPRDRERIFQAFVKGDAERTSTPPALSGGVGLGLPLTRWIAGQLGGDITVDSKPGAGSTFTLRVRTGPLDHAEWVRPEDVCLEPKLPTSLGLPSARYQGRVLLADDFDDTRRLIEEALTSMGVEVVPAADGEEAVRHALRESFDLILMDLRMPRVDGMEATRRLRKQGCLVPIIALTASTTADDEDRIREAGFDGLWRKPIELSELVSRIGDYLRDAPSGAQGRSSIEDRISPDARGRLASIRREFALSLPARVDALREAWKAGRRDRVREILHQLIGSSGIHGFPAVSEEAARIQARVKRNGLDAVESLRTLERLAAEAAESQRQPPSSSSPPTPA
ncbi:MAG: response regulator, partial [Planctomycetota bacterium]